MRELRDEMERTHQEALREAQQRARIEDHEQRKQLDRQRREREEKERRQKEEKRFYEHKGELMNYDFQTSPRIRKESFRDLNVDDIDMLRVALIGPAGSGKTSFVGENIVFPPFSLIRDFGKQNTPGNVSKISVSLVSYRKIGSKSTNHSH